mmetsp:Transcript_4334/g.3637  ORF Transcript_4334/g.3637 Transcript_4334/m.3637 type:complete len:183 (+) Transcript_4334:13-561(+)
MEETDSVKSRITNQKKVNLISPGKKFKTKNEQERSVNRLHRGASLRVKLKMKPRFSNPIGRRISQMMSFHKYSLSTTIKDEGKKDLKDINTNIILNPSENDCNKSMIVHDAYALEASCEKSTDETIGLKDEIRQLKVLIDSQELNAYELRYYKLRKELEREVEAKEKAEDRAQETINLLIEK